MKNSEAFKSSPQRQFAMRALFAAVTLVFVMQLAACNTVEGAGEDIEEAGDAIQDAAD